MVLHARCARRSTESLPFFTRVAAKLSTLGPRSALIDASGSTGLSHNQQIQLSAFPTEVKSLMSERLGHSAMSSWTAFRLRP